MRCKGSSEWFTCAADCRNSGNAFSRALEGDAGTFRLEGGDRSGPLLQTTRISLEGSKDRPEIGATRLGHLNSPVLPEICAKTRA